MTCFRELRCTCTHAFDFLRAGALSAILALCINDSLAAEIDIFVSRPALKHDGEHAEAPPPTTGNPAIAKVSVGHVLTIAVDGRPERYRVRSVRQADIGQLQILASHEDSEDPQSYPLHLGFDVRTNSVIGVGFSPHGFFEIRPTASIGRHEIIQPDLPSYRGNKPFQKSDIVGIGSIGGVVPPETGPAVFVWPPLPTSSKPTLEPPPRVVDLLVVYDPRLAAEVGGDPIVNMTMRTWIASINHALNTSGSVMVFRLVGVEPSAAWSTANGGVLLDQLRNSTGPFAAVNALRVSRGADMVTVIASSSVNLTYGGWRICGLAWIGGYNHTRPTKAQMGSVSQYDCGWLTVAHELGHNLGALHDRTTERIPSGPGKGATSYAFGHRVPGSFATIMAYPGTGTSRVAKFSTPLLFCPGKFPCGRPSGSSTSADNVRTFNETSGFIAALQATTTPSSLTGAFSLHGPPAGGGYDLQLVYTPYGYHVDPVYQCATNPSASSVVGYSCLFDADLGGLLVPHSAIPGVYFLPLGLDLAAGSPWQQYQSFRAHFLSGRQLASTPLKRNADLLWRSNTGAVSYWSMTYDEPTGGFSAAASLLSGPTEIWAPVAHGDFSGDGTSDIVWASTQGAHVVWGNGTSANSKILFQDASWRVVASADLDGDGVSDLLLRNANNGIVVVWFFGPVQNVPGEHVASVIAGGDLNWSVVQTGDFDGNGAHDLVWRNSLTGAVVIHLRTGRGAFDYLASIVMSDTSWDVVGRGDFDGDRIDELLIRHIPSGATFVRFSSGASAGTSVFVGGNLDWSVAAVGDYDGNGVSDVVWRSATSGAHVARRYGFGGGPPADPIAIGSMTLGSGLEWKVIQ